MNSARFTQGASKATTVTLKQDGKVKPPQSNSLKGLPGFIKTTQDPSSSGLTTRVGGGKSPHSKDEKSFGMHREGPIPSRKGNDAGKKFDAKVFGGSSDKSYRGTSTGPAGKIVKNTGEPQKRAAVDQREYKSKTSSVQNKTTLNRKSFPAGNGQVARGKMESLRGRAKTSWEK